MSREQQKRGKQEKGSDGAEKVIVAVKASKEIPKTALVWSLTHVVQPGDCITLLVVVPPQSSGRRLWGFPRFAGDCANSHKKSTPGTTSSEQKNDITDSCSQMILQLHDVYDPNKINVKIKIVSGSPCGSVATEAKKARANWVVLDKQLKHEEKQCMEELQCNIVAMKRSQPKVLRLNLVGSKNKDLEEACPLPSDQAGTSSVSSSDPGTSPFFISEMNAESKKEETIKENQELDDTISDTDSEHLSSSSASLRFQPWITDLLLHQQSSQHTEERSERSHNRLQSSTTRALLEKFSRLDREAEIEISNYKTDLDFGGNVRDAIALSRNAPPGPPPLCSVCQHKAPVFGKPPRWFSYAELELATGGFSQANFLAEGGFGSVHRGVLPDGQVIAVKQHKLASSQGDVEFCSEVEVLSCAQHRNVVMLIGFCIEDKRRLLVGDFGLARWQPDGDTGVETRARPLLEEYAIEELIDPRMGSHYSEHEVSCMLHAASLCLRRDPYCRPRMSQVLRILEGDMVMDSNCISTPGYDVGNRSG
ncbi:Tyrosine-protein kinase, catalytic domain [Sesbania bispinosa]|nr:Tyrosine-protein kinase, catalytic domain [Sesbania bispinosa]